jgi:protoporphyrinogen IX oxidase
MTLGPREVLVVLHVIGNLVWIGSIASTAFLLGSSAAEPRARGELAAEVYKKLAVPAFGLSFLAGLARLALDFDLYLVKTHYMHAKLLFALVAIALHHVIGARAKRAARGGEAAARPTRTMGVVLVSSAALAAFFVLVKPF